MANSFWLRVIQSDASWRETPPVSKAYALRLARRLLKTGAASAVLLIWRHGSGTRFKQIGGV